jgi:ubiquinone/menaquinone biosynthesis C-methylase UbiE
MVMPQMYPGTIIAGRKRTPILKIYERLSQVYDLEWGNFSKRYVDLITQILNQRRITKAKILDLACGTGILAVELARLGHVVHGIDISPEMIERARSRSVDMPSVSFQVGDMRNFELAEQFHLCTCTFDSINYLLKPDEIKQMFFHVARVLERSGMFVFDSNTEQLYMNRHHGTHPRKLGGESFVQKCIYDSKKKEAMTGFEFSDGTTEVHIQRPYELAELEPLLLQAGMGIIDTFGGFDRRQYNSQTERLFCIAEKQ